MNLDDIHQKSLDLQGTFGSRSPSPILRFWSTPHGCGLSNCARVGKEIEGGIEGI